MAKQSTKPKQNSSKAKQKLKHESKIKSNAKQNQTQQIQVLKVTFCTGFRKSLQKAKAQAKAIAR
jgi:hypothetical protein